MCSARELRSDSLRVPVSVLQVTGLPLPFIHSVRILISHLGVGNNHGLEALKTRMQQEACTSLQGLVEAHVTDCIWEGG